MATIMFPQQKNHQRKRSSKDPTMFVNMHGGGETQQQQPLQNQTNASIRHNKPYPHTHSHSQPQQQQQPHYEHYQGPVTLVTYPFCNVAPAAHSNTGGNGVSVGQAGHVFYQTTHQPQSQPHPIQQQVGFHNTEQNLHYFTKSAPLPAHHLHHPSQQQHSQIMNMIAAVSHQRQPFVVSPNYFALSHNLLPQQTLMLTQAHMRAPSSSTPINMTAVGLGVGSAASNAEHSTNIKRKHAIPIINPDSLDIVTFEHLAADVQTQTENEINVESVSIQTDNVNSLTASLARNASDVVTPTQSQSISVQTDDENYDIVKQTSGLAIATQTVSVPVVNTSTQSSYSDSESPKKVTYDDPNDTDADTNEHELDNEDDVLETIDGNSTVACVDQVLQDNISKDQQEIIDIPAGDLLTIQPVLSDSDHSTEVKSKDEPCTISAQTSVDKKDEVKSKEIEHDLPQSVSSFVASEPKSGRKNKKAAKRKEKIQRRMKQHTTSTLKTTSPEIKSMDLKNESEEETPNVLIRYTLEELKAFAKSPESCKTPVVPCQKTDCISQLFVARRQHHHHHLTHQVGQNLASKIKSMDLKNESEEETPNVSIRYTLEELKAFAKSPESCKTPVVPCQKADCISQIHHLTHQVGQNLASEIKSMDLENESKEETPNILIRYTLEDLKAFAKSPESCKTPVVPCQKTDCISQLFVARRQHHHHHLTHQVGQNLASEIISMDLKNESKEETPNVLIRYTLEELKAFAKSPESGKTPVVPCQKSDCISQLFVVRRQHHHHHLTHQVGQNLTSEIKSMDLKNESEVETPNILIRYTLEELKAFAKSPESRKTPVVPCQKADCISQLFIVRRQHHHHHLTHQVGQRLASEIKSMDLKNESEVETPNILIRYTLEDLKAFAKSPESCKTPVVPCQKTDCISQLFVARRQHHHHHLIHQVEQNLASEIISMDLKNESKEETPNVLIRYTLKELKAFAKSPESCKTPVVPCQKTDCISQLFVARRQHHHHHLTHQVGQNLASEIKSMDLKNESEVETPNVLICYTLQELKAFAKSPESCKTPVVPCQKADCISQLFAVRRQHHYHHLTHQVGQNLASEIKSMDLKKEPPNVLIRYTLQELKAFAKSPESCKTPVVPCQKTDCISQLFVARRQHHHHHLTHQVGQNLASEIISMDLKNESKEETPNVLIRYTLEELKAFAKSPESCKTPVVPCQKADCISQLFVARRQHQHHHLTHQVRQNLASIHMNFNKSIEFVSGKRRVGGGVGSGGIQRKHHDHHNNAASTGNINVTGLSVAPGSSGVGGSTSQTQKKIKVIRINLSLNEEIKLSKCENAWQPKFLSRNLNNNSPTTEKSKDDDGDIDDVLKKVRGILNKLTSENFDVLLKEMTSITINTQEKMQKVMLLIFEKTVCEPNFAPTYAKFSKVLFEEFNADNKKVFNSLLIKRLQTEFENNVNNPDAKDRKLQQIVDKLNETTDEQEKVKLQEELEHQEYQFRRRAWGTVRFIGEMYKLHSLTDDRVLQCVESLLEHGNEEKLEYMCKLLTTVGYLLENNDADLFSNNLRMNKIFFKIQTIVKESREPFNKNNKICSRVRFMMQDLIDLRSKNWGQSLSTHSSHISHGRRHPVARFCIFPESRKK